MESFDNSKMSILPQPFDYFNSRSFAVSYVFIDGIYPLIM